VPGNFNHLFSCAGRRIKSSCNVVEKRPRSSEKCTFVCPDFPRAKGSNRSYKVVYRVSFVVGAGIVEFLRKFLPFFLQNSRETDRRKQKSGAEGNSGPPRGGAGGPAGRPRAPPRAPAGGPAPSQNSRETAFPGIPVRAGARGGARESGNPGLAGLRGTARDRAGPARDARGTCARIREMCVV